MKYKPILIIGGEPNSIFLEILIKSLKIKRFKSPIILIVSLEIFKMQLKKLKLNYPFKVVDEFSLKEMNLNNKYLNIIDVKYNTKKVFDKISSKSNRYIHKCFDLALRLMSYGLTDKFINGPISKKFFLKNRYQGITEYLSKKFNISDNFAMIIYDKKISVSPITTHLPIDKVKKNLTTKRIVAKTLLVNNFYKKTLLKSPKIAICGLNPHCENFFIKHSEEKKIIEPAIKILKKKVFIRGPFPADTIFLENNRKKFDIIIGMYHDQVLAPIKTISEFSSVNITIGLPFLRLSPDHGPNYKMVGKNKSNPQSLLNSIKFLDKIN